LRAIPFSDGLDASNTELKDKLLIFEEMDSDEKKRPEAESPPLQSLN